MYCNAGSRIKYNDIKPKNLILSFRQHASRSINVVDMVAGSHMTLQQLEPGPKYDGVRQEGHSIVVRVESVFFDYIVLELWMNRCT